MKLTVFGATGGVGRHVVSQALDCGDEVTAYVRSPAKLEVSDPRLTVIAGELTARDSVRRAVSGADAVINALGPSLDRNATGMPLVEGTRNIVDAMEANATSAWPHPACATSATPGVCSASLSLSWAARS